MLVYGVYILFIHQNCILNQPPCLFTHHPSILFLYPFWEGLSSIKSASLFRTSSSWWFHLHLKKYARQIGSFPQIGMNINIFETITPSHHPTFPTKNRPLNSLNRGNGRSEHRGPDEQASKILTGSFEKLIGILYIYLLKHPRKRTCLLKLEYFGIHLNSPLIFRRHVSFQQKYHQKLTIHVLSLKLPATNPENRPGT